MMKELLLLFTFTSFVYAEPSIGFEFSNDFNNTLNFILAEVDRANIANFLRNFSSRPHLGGTPAEWENAHFVAETWKTQGLDEVHLTPYDVLLSYPVKEKPNYVKLLNTNDEVVWKSQGRTPPLHSEEEKSKDVFPDFNAYSAPGNITGNLVYVNFGHEHDLNYLEGIGISVNGCIVIARYGKVFRANIVESSARRGAIGVILYPDPHEYAKEGPDRVYPDTVFMPGSAAPYGTTQLEDGDPLTPFFPSIESAFRIPEKETTLPKIPVMPIGYNDAAVILSKLAGKEAPSDWQGALNFTYNFGPGFKDCGCRLSMEVNTHNQRTTTYNVVGVMKGIEEPDRYVILGNHRDAWIFGAVDPSSASAVMLELTRVLTEYRRETGWSPRRTLVFCSWGSEEYGLVGSQEWVEQFQKQLSNRGIVYLNLDMAIEGNYTVRTKSSPLLYNIGREISKLVPNPDPEEVRAGRSTVFDTWLYRNPDEKRPGYPRFTGLGSGSDYKGFQHNLGIPSLEYRYTHSKEMFSEPLYHTLYETFYLVSELYDKGFHFHASITQLWGLIAVYIAEAEVIPFSLDEYALFIDDAKNSIFNQFGVLIEGRNITFGHFDNASKIFAQEVENFKKNIDHLDTKNPLALRRINDQLMLVERAFIDARGLPGRPHYNHVVFAPSSTDNYAATAFAGLSDALNGIEDLPEDEQNRLWRTFEEHLATCTYLLMSASKILSEELW
ncbi:UNVERIFIED_CONTAM: hypothetical protein RMT77_010589 [Armadillidium vulgare]